MALDVMIVDDSAAIRKILERVLRHADLHLGDVVEAGDGREALEKLQSRNIGLILSDINMPNMDGIEFLQRVKANEIWKAVPIIMVTTEGSQDKVLQAIQLGASGYIRKPFTADQIKEKLIGIV
jgi:two-component system chemotaxis response regulator CheY